jgi:hypothetical protein
VVNEKSKGVLSSSGSAALVVLDRKMRFKLYLRHARKGIWAIYRGVRGWEMLYLRLEFALKVVPGEIC